MCTDPPSIGWMTLLQEFFNTYQRYFYFQYHQNMWSIKNISKHLFHLIRSSTKVIELDKVKIPKNVSSKDGF